VHVCVRQAGESEDREPSINMSATSSQLTVSAIRQHFESYVSYTAANTPPDIRPKHAVPSKPSSESETTAAKTQRKQPPETRPKPKTTAAAAAQSHFVSAGDPCNGTHTGVDSESQRTCDTSPFNKLTAENVHHDHPCDDRSLQHQTRRASANRRSRDESDAIVSTSRKPGVVSRWSSASSLLQSADAVARRSAAEDVRLAISNVRQKPVLQRIVGMKLAAEHLPEPIREAAAAAEDSADDDDDDTICDDTTTSSHGDLSKTQRSEKSILQCETTQPTSTSLTSTTADSENASSGQSCVISTDDNDKPAPPADVEPEQPIPLHADALEQTVEVLSEPSPHQPSAELEQNVEACGPTHTLSPSDAGDETATKNEESELSERQLIISGQQTRRPISLYPQDAELNLIPSPVTDIDTAPAATVGDDVQRLPVSDDHTASEHRRKICDATTAPADNGEVVSPLMTTTFNLTSVRHPKVAPSRQSVLIIGEFVSENFSFLDELDDDIAETPRPPADISEHDEEQSNYKAVAFCGPKSGSTEPSEQDAATAELCSTDRRNDKAEKTTTENTDRSERPKSSSRKSIVLPSGDIVEIIGKEFTFLDDYDNQTVECDSDNPVDDQ